MEKRRLCNLLKSLHSSSRASWAARHYASLAPRLHVPKNRPRNSGARPTNRSLQSVPIWPMNLIRLANSSGTLDVSPEASVGFLNSIWGMVSDGQLHRGSIEATMQEYELDIRQLAVIGRVLVTRRADSRIASLGMDLLSTSAELGDESAAFILGNMFISKPQDSKSQNSRYRSALAVIQRLATEHPNLQALVLMGKIHEYRNQFDDAMVAYLRAIELESQGSESSIDGTRSAFAEAFRNAGRLSLNMGDNKNVAISFLESAAFEYDDAESFYMLAISKGVTDPEYSTLMSQAAISGQLEAAYALGLWYATTGDELVEEEEARSEAYLIAIHWFEMLTDVKNLEVGAKMHLARIDNLTMKKKSWPTSRRDTNLNAEIDCNLPPKIQSLYATWKTNGFPATAAALELDIQIPKY